MSSDNDSNPSVPDGSTDREEILKVRLTAYLLGEDGELGENGREELERELEQSESLRQELELLRRTVDAVKRAAPRLEALEPRRRGELIETASASAGRGGRARTVWYSLSGLAAAAALVLLLWPLFVSDSGEPQAALESGPGEGGELLAMEMKRNRLTATSPGGKRQEWKTEVLLGDGDVRTTKRYAEFLEVQAARPRGLEKLRQLTSDELESGESVPPAAKAAPESQNLLSKTFEWGTPGNDLRGSYGRRRSGSAGLGGAAEGERQARNDTSRPDGSRWGRLTTAPAAPPALPAGAEPIRDTGLDGKYKAGVMTGGPGRRGEAGAPAAVARSIRSAVEPRVLVDDVLSQLDRRA
ncbi:MAG: hypothetical protein O7J95_02880, partial [Planctomycetota bacterium]|nr:hypothetical protein [Planctomycetota bacterium]